MAIVTGQVKDKFIRVLANKVGVLIKDIKTYQPKRSTSKKRYDIIVIETDRSRQVILETVVKEFGGTFTRRKTYSGEGDVQNIPFVNAGTSYSFTVVTKPKGSGTKRGKIRVPKGNKGIDAERYFVEKINQYVNEFASKDVIFKVGGRRVRVVKDVVSAQAVGTQTTRGRKTDVILKTQDGKEIKFSLKLPSAGFWGRFASDERLMKEAKKALDYAAVPTNERSALIELKDRIGGGKEIQSTDEHRYKTISYNASDFTASRAVYGTDKPAVIVFDHQASNAISDPDEFDPIYINVEKYFKESDISGIKQDRELRPVWSLRNERGGKIYNGITAEVIPIKNAPGKKITLPGWES